MKYIFYFLPFIAGAAMTTQVAVNAQLKTDIQSPLVAAFISFIVDTFVIGLAVLFSKEPIPSIRQLIHIDLYNYSGGLLGATFVTTIILSVQKIGPTNMFALIIAGQLTASIIYEDFGLLGFKIVPVHPYKLLGILLLVIGAILINKK